MFWIHLDPKSARASCPQEADEDFASAGSEHEQPQMDEADGRYDNQDEVEEADHLQHLREAGCVT